MRIRGGRSRLRRRLGVKSLAIVGGLLVLLMMTGVACDDPDSKAAGEPTAPSPGLTGTATSQPPVTGEPTSSPTPVTEEPMPSPTPVTGRTDAFTHAGYGRTNVLTHAGYGRTNVLTHAGLRKNRCLHPRRLRREPTSSPTDEAVTIQAPQIHIGSPAPPTVPTASEELRSAKERAAPAATDSALANLVQGNSAFALDLYQNLRDKDGNLFYSPYSISLALAMLYAGARGETERQMADTLRFLLVQEDLHPAFNALDLKLASRGGGAEGKDDQGFRLNIVNALWGQGGCSFLPEFLDVLGESYGAGVRPLNFLEAPEESRTTINDWVSEQTEDRIKDLIPEGGISPSTFMVLTNAIYFNAAWAHPFEPEDTRDGQFHLIDGNSVNVPMMRQTKTFGYARGESGYQALELPYDGRELSMVILLPDRGSFSGFEESLDADVVNGATSRMSFRPVSLTMPKFEFESSFDLSDTLKSMGMPDAFLRTKANLSGMGISGCPGGGGRPFISDVVHKAFVLVEEEGTEAAAATGAVVVRLSISSPSDRGLSG